MTNQKLAGVIAEVFAELDKLIPEYMQNPADKNISNGNLAVCIIDDAGVVHGKMFGTNRPRLRQSYKVAWIKASQVWLTGVKTGEYERLVFTNQVPENSNGIENPDLIGWIGGQPVTLKTGETLSVGFSGFRGATDIEIVVRAFENVNVL